MSIFILFFKHQGRDFLRRVFVTAPLFFTAIGVTVGILLYWYTTSVMQLFLLAMFWLGASVAFFPGASINQRFYVFLLPILLCIFGFFSAYKQNQEFLRKQRQISPGSISVRGVVYDIEKTKNPIFPYEVTIRTNECALQDGEWFSCVSCMKIMTKRYGSFSVDDTVELSGLASNKVDQSFGYFLMKEDISIYVFVPYLRSVILSRPYYSIRRLFYRKRGALYQEIKKTCSDRTMIFFKMLFLGKKERHSDEAAAIDDYFKRWGIMHMTARSGMHMTLYVLLCTMLLQFFPLPFVLKQMMLVLSSILYALFSYPSVSFLRALATSFGIIVCHCITRRSDFLHVTLVVYIIQLLINPITLFFLDFQLSFLLTIGIGFFFKKYFYKLLI